MKPYRLVVFDLDGVLYRGTDTIPGAKEAVAQARAMGIVTRFLTNNSTRTRRQFAEKLTGFGIPSKAEEVYGSAAGAALYLSKIGVREACVIGEAGLRAELEEKGIESTSDNGQSSWVVAGACWSLTYDMIDEAQWRIRNGAKFLATNPDPTFPVEGGRLRPGAGTVVAAISTAAGMGPDVMIGKPEPTLIEMILEETGVAREETLVIGDQPGTDIECARRAGVDSALVLTGVVSEPANGHVATYVFGDVGNVIDAMSEDTASRKL